MAIVFAESFAQYDTGFAARSEYWNSWGNSGGGQINSASSTPFSDSVNKLATANDALKQSTMPNVISGSEDEYVVQFYLYTNYVTTIRMVQFKEASSVHCEIFWNNTTENISFRRNTTTLVSSSNGTVPKGQWMYFQVKMNVHDTTGACSVYVNGVEILSTTGQDTRNGGTGIIDEINFGTGFEMQELLIMDTNGGANDDITSNSIRVRTARPDGVGNSSDFTPTAGSNWQTVDGGYTSSEYSSSGTVSDKDTHTLTAAPTDMGTVLAVMPWCIADKDTSDPRSIATVSRTSTNESTGSNSALDLSFARMHFHIDTVDPTTTVAWTESGINGAEAGYTVTV